MKNNFTLPAGIAMLIIQTPVEYYLFNINTNDATGNWYKGIVNGNSLTTDRFGNANCTYSFKITNNNIIVQDGTNLWPEKNIKYLIK